MERPRAGYHRVADLPGSGGEFAPVARHPDVVPAEHSYREEQDHRVQQFLANAGRVLTRETLIDRVWGPHYVGDTKTLDVHVKRLRSKIEDDPAVPRRIVTIRGLGYKFDAARV